MKQTRKTAPSERRGQERVADEKWRTALTSIEPNKILLRGYPLDEIMGRLTGTPALDDLELDTFDAIVVCGGLGGVMDAAARGCEAAGGVSIGILPGERRGSAGLHLTVSIPTGLGEARNALVVRAADAVINPANNPRQNRMVQES